MGKGDDIQEGYTAMITRIESDDSGSTTKTIRGVVVSVEKDRSFIKPLDLLRAPKNESDPNEQKAVTLLKDSITEDIKLNPNDAVFYRVTVAPPEPTTVSAVHVAAVQQDLAVAGLLRLQLKFTIGERDGTTLPVGKDSYFAEVKVDGPAHFTNGSQTATLVLEPTDREFFKSVEAPRTELGVAGVVIFGDHPHPRPEGGHASHPWKIWTQLVLFAWVLAGGAIGATVRTLGARQGTQWLTMLVEAAIGCVAGSIVLLVLLTLPGAYKLSGTANLASGMTCLAIGLGGGFTGIAGLRWSLGSFTTLQPKS
jgi:hypothetical protein